MHPNLSQMFICLANTSFTSHPHSQIHYDRLKPKRALEVMSCSSCGYTLTANMSGQSLTSLQRLYLISRPTQITPNTSAFKGQTAYNSCNTLLLKDVPQYQISPAKGQPYTRPGQGASVLQPLADSSLQLSPDS